MFNGICSDVSYAIIMLTAATDVEMPQAPSDASYGQQPPPSAIPRGPSPVLQSSSPAGGFSQPPTNQAMMPGFPQPSFGGASSNSYPVAAPRSHSPSAARSQPMPQVTMHQQPPG